MKTRLTLIISSTLFFLFLFMALWGLMTSPARSTTRVPEVVIGAPAPTTAPPRATPAVGAASTQPTLDPRPVPEPITRPVAATTPAGQAMPIGVFSIPIILGTLGLAVGFLLNVTTRPESATPYTAHNCLVKGVQS